MEGSLKGRLARRLPKSKWENQLTQKSIHHHVAFQERLLPSLNRLKDQIQICEIITINQLTQSIHESSYHVTLSINERKPHNVEKRRSNNDM